MDIRNEIRRIINEELASLVNPLDATTDAISSKSLVFKDKVQNLRDKIVKNKKDLTTDLAAKKKALMVPQSNDAALERQRRQVKDLEIKDIGAKLKTNAEEEQSLDDLDNSIGDMSTSLSDMEKEKENLTAMIAKISGQEL